MLEKKCSFLHQRHTNSDSIGGPYQIEGIVGEGTYMVSNSKGQGKIFNVENIRTSTLQEENEENFEEKEAVVIRE